MKNFCNNISKHENYYVYYIENMQTAFKLNKKPFIALDEPVTSQELTPISAHTSLKQVVDSLVQHVISDPSLNVSITYM